MLRRGIPGVAKKSHRWNRTRFFRNRFLSRQKKKRIARIKMAEIQNKEDSKQGLVKTKMAEIQNWIP